MNHWLLKNSDGKHSGSFTAATISFIVVTVCLIMSVVNSITIGTTVIAFKAVDTTFALGYLAATFSAYVVRRNAAQDAATKNTPTKTTTT